MKRLWVLQVLSIIVDEGYCGVSSYKLVTRVQHRMYVFLLSF
ncbi:MAG: hypothetical protein ABWW69_06785 [Pyrodictiaceae archaeon]